MDARVPVQVWPSPLTKSFHLNVTIGFRSPSPQRAGLRTSTRCNAHRPHRFALQSFFPHGCHISLAFAAGSGCAGAGALFRSRQVLARNALIDVDQGILASTLGTAACRLSLSHRHRRGQRPFSLQHEHDEFRRRRVAGIARYRVIRLRRFMEGLAASTRTGLLSLHATMTAPSST